MERSELLALPPSARLDRDIVAKYVECLRRNCRETTIAIMLERLRLVLMVICKENDWSWLRTITDRIRTRAARSSG
jgi:hypothetical protein